MLQACLGSVMYGLPQCRMKEGLQSKDVALLTEYSGRGVEVVVATLADNVEEQYASVCIDVDQV